MTVQNNSPQRFNFNSNNRLVLAPNAAERLILPEGIGLEPEQVNDKPALIIPQDRKTPEHGYSQVNGIFIPTGTETTGAIQIVQAGSSDIRYGKQETRFSFEEVLHNSLEKIIKLEADNPSIKDIQEYFGRLEDLTQSYKKDRGILMHNKPSLAPLVMNREAFKKKLTQR